MGTTTADGVIRQVPYGLVRNFRDAGRERITVLVYDSDMKLRDQYVQRAQLNAGVPFYVNDTVKVLYERPSQGATNICDVITVNPTTGAEATASTRGFSARLQRSLVIKCTAINGSSGVATLTVSNEVFT